MDLNHRLINVDSANKWKIAMHRINQPLGYVIPLFIAGLSLFSIYQYFGSEWQVGNFSTPLAPWIGQILGNIFQADPLVMISDIVLFIYALGSVTCYFLIYLITRRHLPAVMVGLLSILPRFAFSNSPPEKLILAIQDNDGAHIMALTFVFIAASLFFYFVKKGLKKYLIWFCLIAALLTAISFFSLHVLFIMMIFISISEIMIGEGKKKIKRFLTATFYFILLVIAIYNKSLLVYFQSDASQVSFSVLINLLPLLFFIIPVIGTFVFLVFDRRPYLQAFFIAFALSLVFGLLHLVRISFVDIPLLDQDRYIAEMSIAFYALFSIFITWGFDLLRAGKFIENKPILLNNRTKIAFLSVGIIILTIVALILFIPRSL